MHLYKRMKGTADLAVKVNLCILLQQQQHVYNLSLPITPMKIANNVNNLKLFRFPFFLQQESRGPRLPEDVHRGVQRLVLTPAGSVADRSTPWHATGHRENFFFPASKIL